MAVSIIHARDLSTSAAYSLGARVFLGAPH